MPVYIKIWSASVPNGGLSYQVSDMAQWVKVLDSKPDHLSLIPGTHKLPSDLHTAATHTPLTQQYTNVLNSNKIPNNNNKSSSWLGLVGAGL